MFSIRQLAQRLDGNTDVVVASALSRLIPIADIIEQDVKVQRADS
jgi:hypothetical protein